MRSRSKLVITAALVGVGIAGNSYAAPQKGPRLDERSESRLRAMSAYLASIPSFTFRGDNTTQLVNGSQKLDMTAESKVTVRRPDRFRADREGELASVTFFYDGKSITLYGKTSNYYATAPAPDTIDKTAVLVDDELALELPAADLIRADSYSAVLADALEGRFIGEATIDGVRCDHLAFVGRETDAQIWIEQGQRALPRKYIITNKKQLGWPQHAITLHDWDVQAKPGDDVFKFVPPEGSTKLQFLGLRDQLKKTPGK